MQEAAARDAAAAAAAAASSHHGGGYRHQHHQNQHQQPQQLHGLSEHHLQPHQLHHNNIHPHLMMDNMEESIASLSMDSEQLGLLRALHAAEMGDHSSLHDSINLMGIDPNDATSMQSLLHMLAQQEQENARPEEHYLTIAQNGESQREETIGGWIVRNLDEYMDVEVSPVVLSCCLLPALGNDV